MGKFTVVASFVALVVGGIVFWNRPMAHVAAEPPANRPFPAPEFAEGTPWLQSKPLTLASLRGQVLVVQFWTFGCSNCIHNYPVYKAWQGQYAGKGLTIVGIHTPEFAHEADAKQVQAKAEKNGLKFPIVIDNDNKNWKNWNNHYWPSIYLVDKKGQVRDRWEGELHLDTPEGKRFAGQIDTLLAEKP